MMFAPVTHGARQMGVLAVVQHAGKPAFNAHEFEIFRSAAEQCAFALANAQTQQEALKARQLEADIRSASEVQRILLRPILPAFGAFQFAAANLPAKVMSGDYYDIISPDENHCGVIIADVSGKGFPASLLMATCRALLRGTAGTDLSPARVLARVNRLLWGDVREDMFISLVYCLFDKTSDTVTLARAGHDAPLHYSHARHEVTPLKPPGLALGVDSGKVFERATQDFTFKLAPGDCLLLYTDGVNEAENPQGEQFGMARLTATLQRSAGRGAQAILDAFHADLRAFVGEASQLDDITLLVIQHQKTQE
jgi:phosphoserine phosphatase RsbU/P